MKFKMKALVAVSAVCVSSLASAQWYVGATAGSSHTSLNWSSLATTPAPITSVISKTESDTGYKAQVGYQFNKNFAVEGGYVNLGQFSATNNVTYPGGPGSVGFKVKSDGWNLLAVGMLPLNNNFTLLGKVGAFMSTTTATVAASGTVTLTGPTSSSNSDTNLTYGVGVDYSFNKAWSVRGEAESFVDLRPSSTGSKGSVNLYSLGVIYKF